MHISIGSSGGDGSYILLMLRVHLAFNQISYLKLAARPTLVQAVHNMLWLILSFESCEAKGVPSYSEGLIYRSAC